MKEKKAKTIALPCRAGAQRSQTSSNKVNFKKEVRQWAEKLQVQPAQIRVQKMRGKWASCSPDRWITFNDALLSESKEFQRYVIVHELLHLRVPNHGKLFKSLMSIHLPDWEKW